MIFADRLMGLGFGHAAKAGISFGKDDLIIPKEKPELILKTQTEVKRIRAAISGRSDHGRRTL